MCRGSNLGVCCEQDCDERITCQDTGGYCNAHDPYDWESPSNNVADDPEKRRVYDLSRLTRAISVTEATIRRYEDSLADLRTRAAALEVTR